MGSSSVYTWDQRRYLVIPGDKERTLHFCIEHFITTAKHAIKDHDKFFVALSGGSTPEAIYKGVSSNSNKDQIDWSKVYLFWSDERSVPPSHEESNFRMAMEAGLKNVGVPRRQIFRMIAEDNIEQNARIYEQQIKDTLEGRSFDLMMLGMGDDGHTASLFPGSSALQEKKKWAVANYIPQKKTWRMTLTIPCINSSEHCALYVLGGKKSEMASKVLTQSGAAKPYPAAHIGTSEHKALWILDQDAAKGILKYLDGRNG